MKRMNTFGICVLSVMAIALTGCGKKKGNAAAPQPQHPNQQWQQQNPNWQNQQVNQPYQCQAGFIQLRNSFGSAQCYQTTDLNQACAQAGGYLAQGNLCRRERQIQGSLSGTFRNRNGHYPANIPLRANLYPGEAFKLYGNVDALSNDAYDWSAQLVQNGAVLGSASSGGFASSSGNNLVIVSMGTGAGVYGNPYGSQFPQQYPQQYPNQVPPNVQCVQAPCPGNVWPQQNQWQQPSMYSMAVPTQFSLQLLFEGKVKLKLYGAAISCEDGRGNSYPCQ